MPSDWPICNLGLFLQVYNAIINLGSILTETSLLHLFLIFLFDLYEYIRVKYRLYFRFTFGKNSDPENG